MSECNICVSCLPVWNQLPPCLWWKHGSAHVLAAAGGRVALLLLSEQMMATRFSAAVIGCDRYLDALKARLKKATHRQESTVTHPPRHPAFIIITERVKARFPERSDPDRFLPAGTWASNIHGESHWARVWFLPFEQTQPFFQAGLKKQWCGKGLNVVYLASVV